MSARYEQVKLWYDLGLWSAARVRAGVERGWLSAGEYEQITGKKY